MERRQHVRQYNTAIIIIYSAILYIYFLTHSALVAPSDVLANKVDPDQAAHVDYTRIKIYPQEKNKKYSAFIIDIHEV